MLKLLQGAALAIGITVIGVHSCADIHPILPTIEQIFTGPVCVCPDEAKTKLTLIVPDRITKKNTAPEIAKKKIAKKKFSGGSHRHKSHGSHHHKSFPPSHSSSPSSAPSHAPTSTPPSTGPPCCP
jgi:hypothetical protein